MSDDEWTEVARLEVGQSATVKTGGRQLAVFRLADRACVIDNRCPHEGYPLAQGAVDGGVLTCAWHNWKFRLADGACLVGGESVRSYDTRVHGDRVEARLVDPPREAQVEALQASLLEAVDDDDPGRVARTLERLLALGEPPLKVLGFMVDRAAERLEWGFHHGLAATADLAALLARGHAPGLVLLQATELLMEGLQRRPALPFVEPCPGDLDALPAHIANEEREAAEGVVRGASDREALLDALATAGSDGFLDFGHGLIFAAKAEELLDAIGPEHDHPVLTVLARGLVYATREHTLPTMQHLARQIAERAPLALTEGDAPLEADRFLAWVLDGSMAEALDAVDEAIGTGVAPRRVALALGLAAGERLLRFDPRHELDDEVAEGWLDITHALTFAEAAHSLLVRRPSDALLRALRYGAHFVWRAGPLDGGPMEVSPAGSGPIRGALDARDEARARTLAREAPLTDLRAELEADVLGDRLTRAIFVAHHVKTVEAALRLAEAAESDPDLGPHARTALEGAVRWLCHPMRERRIARNAHVAHHFITRGRRIRELSR